MTRATQQCVSFSDVLCIGEHHHQIQQSTMLRFRGDVFIYIADSSIFRLTEQRENVFGIL